MSYQQASCPERPLILKACLKKKNQPSTESFMYGLKSVSCGITVEVTVYYEYK